MINRRIGFKNAKNFIIYYGTGNEEELSRYDVAIVEPQGQNRSSIEVIQNAKTLVIAYVSAVEILKNSPMFDLLKEEDFLKLNGSVLMNREYETYLLDLRSKRWNSILIQYIGNLIVNENYDGIFIDTLGDIEWDIIPPEVKNELLFATRALLNNVRSIFDDIIIIQNNGIHQVINFSLGFVDGLCWENAEFKEPGESYWVDATIDKLRNLRKEEGIKIFLVYEESRLDKSGMDSIRKGEMIAGTNNFLFYSANKYAY